MAERGQQPLHEPYNPGRVLPFLIVEIDRVLFRAGYMPVQQFDDFLILPVEHDFVLVAETPVIHVGRAHEKAFLIHKQAFGMEQVRSIEFPLDSRFVHGTQVFVAEDVH